MAAAANNSVVKEAYLQKLKNKEIILTGKPNYICMCVKYYNTSNYQYYLLVFKF